MEANLTSYDIGEDITHDLLAWETSSAWTSPGITHEAAGIEQIADWESALQRAIAHTKAIRSQGSFVRATWSPSNVTPEATEGEKIYDVIESLYLSNNRPRDRQIAERIIALHRDSLDEDERIIYASLHQFAKFFLAHPDLSLPKITLTPDSTLRARWIQGVGSFTAIEFTGKPLVKLVAEIPRQHGLTGKHFSAEPVDDILSCARAIGALFT